MSDPITIKATEIVEATNSLNSCGFFTSKEPALRVLNAKVSRVAEALLRAKPSEKQELLVAVIKAQDAAQKSLSSNSFIARFFPNQQGARNKIDFQVILGDSTLKGNVELAKLEIALETLEASSLLGKVEALENVTKQLKAIAFGGDVNPEYAVQCLALLQKTEMIIQKLTGSIVDKRLFSDHIATLKDSIDGVVAKLKANQWDKNPEVTIALLDFYILQLKNYLFVVKDASSLISHVTECLKGLGVTFPEKEKKTESALEWGKNMLESTVVAGQKAVSFATQGSVLNSDQKSMVQLKLKSLSAFVGPTKEQPKDPQEKWSANPLEKKLYFFKEKLEGAIIQLSPVGDRVVHQASALKKGFMSTLNQLFEEE